MSTNPWIVFLRHGYPRTESGRKKPADLAGAWISYMSSEGYRKNDAKYGCLNGRKTRGNVKSLPPDERRAWLPVCFQAPRDLPNFKRPNYKRPQAKVPTKRSAPSCSRAQSSRQAAKRRQNRQKAAARK